MKNLTLKSSALLATLLITGAALSTVASAATTIGGDAKSSANLTLQAGTGPVDPKDPDNPDVTPVIPTDPPTPGSPGNITVDYGSTFEFGTQTISTSEKVYYAHPDGQEGVQVDANGDFVKDSSGNYVGDGNFVHKPLHSQVTDQSGDLAGWTLTLTQKEDFHLVSGSATDPGYKLAGAQIAFKNGRVVGGINTATAPSGVVTSGVLIPGKAVKLVSAAAGEGAGTWVYNFGATTDYDTSSVDFTTPTDKSKIASKSPISLTVPAGLTQKAAAYTTELIWSLQATPGNDWTYNPSAVTKP